MGVSGDEVDDGDKDHDEEGDDHDDVGNHESVGQEFGSDKSSYLIYLFVPKIPDTDISFTVHFSFFLNQRSKSDNNFDTFLASLHCYLVDWSVI